MVIPNLAPLTSQDPKTTLWSLISTCPLFHPHVPREERWRHRGQRLQVGIRKIYGNINKIRKQTTTATILITSGQTRECEAWPDCSHATQITPSSQGQPYPTAPSASLTPGKGMSFPSPKWEKEALSSTPGSGIRWCWMTVSWLCSLPLIQAGTRALFQLLKVGNAFGTSSCHQDLFFSSMSYQLWEKTLSLSTKFYNFFLWLPLQNDYVFPLRFHVHGAKQRVNTPSSFMLSGNLIIQKMAPSGKLSWRLLAVKLL